MSKQRSSLWVHCQRIHGSRWPSFLDIERNGEVTSKLRLRKQLHLDIFWWAHGHSPRNLSFRVLTPNTEVFPCSPCSTERLKAQTSSDNPITQFTKKLCSIFIFPAVQKLLPPFSRGPSRQDVAPTPCPSEIRRFEVCPFGAISKLLMGMVSCSLPMCLSAPPSLKFLSLSESSSSNKSLLLSFLTQGHFGSGQFFSELTCLRFHFVYFFLCSLHLLPQIVHFFFPSSIQKSFLLLCSF